MTTQWKIKPEWHGQTVAVLGSAETMTVAIAEQLRQHRTIAVNHTVKLAPWADMLVALDHPWPQAFQDFEQLRVCGCPDDKLDALYPGWLEETVELGPGTRVQIRNSGLAAIRIAMMMGAARIIAAGFLPESGRRWHDDEVDTGDYVGVRAGLHKLAAECLGRGIKFELWADGQVQVAAVNLVPTQQLPEGLTYAADVAGTPAPLVQAHE